MRLLAGLAFGAIAIVMSDAAESSQTGNATVISTRVSGVMDGLTTILASGDPIYENQRIATDANGVAEFLFRDQTQLAVGPGSSVVLDSFVYDANRDAGKVVIGMTRGALRFVTGDSPHDAYVINTPEATIGVRGTAFDLFSDGNGEIAIAMIEGEVEVCPRSGECRLHSLIGNILHLTRDGIFSLHSSWNGSFLRDVGFAAALPFMAGQNVLSPKLRASAAVTRRYAAMADDALRDAASTAEEVVRDAGRAVREAIDEIPQPELKVPNPFR